MMTATRKRPSLTVASILVGALMSTAHAAANEVLDPLQPAGVWSETAFGNAPLPPMVVRTSIFPSANGAGPEETSFRPLVDQLHSMQLKAGIYTDIGRNACSHGYPQPDSLLPTGSVAEREVGSFDHVDQDMSLYFREWGFDYIKVDGCGLNAFGKDRPAVKDGQFRAFPVYVVSDAVSTRELFSGPGHWNDPDMLFVGHGDFDALHLTEARTHFALWAIEDAPLIIGYDLRRAPKSLLNIWGAAEIVAINQDKAGNQGVFAFTSDDLQIIVKQLSNRDEKAVVIFNRGTEPLNATLTASHLKFSSTAPIRVRDLWSRRDLPPFTKERSFALAPRESVMLRVQGRPELRDGLYLSEMPARIYVAADGIRALEGDPEIHRPVPEDTGTRGTGPRPALAGWGGPRADSTPYAPWDRRLFGIRTVQQVKTTA